MSLTDRLRGEFLNSEKLPEKLSGKLMTHFENQYGIVLVVKTNDGRLVNINENQKTIHRILALGYDNLDQLKGQDVYFEKKSWTSYDGERSGFQLVIYQIGKNKYTESAE